MQPRDRFLLGDKMNDEFLIRFLAAGFQNSYAELENNLTTLLETRMATLLEKIAEIKAGQSLGNEQLQELITTSTEEREQVGGLVNLSLSQQETIAQLTAKVNELGELLAGKDAETTAAFEALEEVLGTATEQSTEIETAIESIKQIYNPA